MTDELGARLRAAREAITPEINQRDVARMLEMSPSAINLWEKGKTEPSAHNLAELSKWYNVSADWLLGIENQLAKRGKPSGEIPLFTVPVVPAAALVRWSWEAVTEVLQTTVAYPHGTAAAVLVSSDALSTTCPTGCYVVIAKGHGVQPGQIVMVALNKVSDPVLRKYIREGADELLVADDTRFPSYRLADGAKVIGRVTEVVIRKTIS